MGMKNDISAQRVRDVLNYLPETGVFYWRKSFPRVAVGSVAGRVLRSGYRIIQVDGKQRLAHRLAWLWVNGRWPTRPLDHINGNKDDNSISNLRQVTASQNQCGRGILRNNSSGYRGVTWNKRVGRWQASIMVRGKSTYLGLFDDAQEAARAYDFAAASLHGNYARTNADMGLL